MNVDLFSNLAQVAGGALLATVLVISAWGLLLRIDKKRHHPAE